MHFFFIQTALVALAVVPNKPQPHEKALQGTWVVVEFVDDGESTSDVVKIVFRGEKMVLISGKKMEFLFKLNLNKKPGEIDITAVDGEFKGKLARGIYELNKDELKLCVPNDDKIARPTEFKSPRGSQRILFTLKRSRP